MAVRKRKIQPIVQSTALLHGIKPYVAKKGEKYMNNKQQDHFRDILKAWRQELLDEIYRTVHQLRDEPDNPPDPNDRASQETDMTMELRSRDRESKLIKKIDEALERIEKAEYGYCDVCGVDVGIERLEARPTAELCIDCKTLDEIREKQMG
jgi:DnaK suppressor protein